MTETAQVEQKRGRVQAPADDGAGVAAQGEGFDAVGVLGVVVGQEADVPDSRVTQNKKGLLTQEPRRLPINLLRANTPSGG